MPKSQREDGFTLVETLVVMSLMTVVATLTTGLLITGLGSTKQTQARISASQNVQREVERLARDLRVADPLRVAEPDRVVMDLYRGGRCVRRTYQLTSNTLTVSSLTYATWTACARYPSTAAPSTTENGTLLRNTANGALPMLAYRGVAGVLPASPPLATVSAVTVSLSSSVPGQPGGATLSTTVGVRNATH